MARIKIECFKEDKEKLNLILSTGCYYSHVSLNNEFRYPCENCTDCINENVEFVIKEESNE